MIQTPAIAAALLAALLVGASASAQTGSRSDEAKNTGAGADARDAATALAPAAAPATTAPQRPDATPGAASVEPAAASEAGTEPASAGAPPTAPQLAPVTPDDGSDVRAQGDAADAEATEADRAAQAAQAAQAAEAAEIAAELAALGAAEPQDAPPAPAPTAASPSRNLMNPAISANGLLLAGHASRQARQDGDLETGIALQEIELRLEAVVDPYLRADLTLAAHEDEIGFEEVYISTLEIPRVTIRAGLFPAALGRHNQLHTHAFPFVTAPLPSRVLLGPEGLRDPGVSADVLLPLPFYAELNLQVFAGEWAPFQGDPGASADADLVMDAGADAAMDADAVDADAIDADAIDADGHGHAEVEDARRRHDFAYVSHLKTLLELGEATTLELGASYAAGRNGHARLTDIIGGDITLKWRPLSAERYTGLDWSSEYIAVRRRGAADERRRGGIFSGLRYQFAQRIWVQARGGLLGLPRADSPRTQRTELLLAFIPSEFSGLRLQYAYESTEDNALPDVHEIFLQAIFSIGPHAPHDY